MKSELNHLHVLEKERLVFASDVGDANTDKGLWDCVLLLHCIGFLQLLMGGVPRKTEKFMLGVLILPRYSAADSTLDETNDMNHLLN